MKIVVLCNSTGGVGKTTMVYHLAHMLPRLGIPALAVDLDPQANLTAAFLDEDELEKLWDEGDKGILGSVGPILKGTGDIAEPFPLLVADGLHLISGDLGLSRFEEKLSESFAKVSLNDEAALRATTAFYRIIHGAGEATGAEIALVDVGPNLGAINRAALLATDHLIIPLAADLFSLQGLRNLGPTIRQWRQQWSDMQSFVSAPFLVPAGSIEPSGYVILQHAVRLDRPEKHQAQWMQRIPDVYREAVLGTEPKAVPSPDPACLGILRNYRSLMPMAQDARKPMFDLRPADGAIGSHAALAGKCHEDFEALAQKLLEMCDLEAGSR